jgi:hypothetical protein
VASLVQQVQSELKLVEVKNQIEDFLAEKENFLNLLKRKNEHYFKQRKAIGDFNYGRRIPGTEKC